jgi:two-component system NtrC family sensor kinase
MSEHEIAHIFDPFFTTKDPGKGTGLGLSVCYRIVEGLGGAIRAESTQGGGMTLVITLPLMNHKGKRGHD